MKEPNRRAGFLIAMFATGALVTSCGANAAREDNPCHVGDITKTLDVETAAFIQKTQGDWVRNARECDLGTYRTITPADGSTDHLIVIHRDHDFLYVDPAMTTLFDDNGQHVAVQTVRGSQGKDGSLAYRAHDPSRNVDVELVDTGPDGEADIRTIDFPDGTFKIEYRVGTSWYELVKQDGHFGVSINGKFMAVPEARAILEVHRHGAAK